MDTLTIDFDSLNDDDQDWNKITMCHQITLCCKKNVVDKKSELFMEDLIIFEGCGHIRCLNCAHDSLQFKFDNNIMYCNKCREFKYFKNLSGTIAKITKWEKPETMEFRAI